MSVFRDVEIEWEGEVYTFSPDMRLLMLLEQSGVSIEAISMHANQGRVMKATIATAMSIVLGYAGASVSPEKMLQEVEHNPVEATGLFVKIRDALYTSPPEGVAASKKNKKASKAEG